MQLTGALELTITHVFESVDCTEVGLHQELDAKLVGCCLVQCIRAFVDKMSLPRSEADCLAYTEVKG